jgi:hypothetical protein
MARKPARLARASRVLGILAFGIALAMPAASVDAHPVIDRFPVKGVGIDNGCGAVQWADTAWTLLFTVEDNGDGTYAMRTDYRGGTFVTRAGTSPGANCGTLSHGTSVVAGIRGRMFAWAEETITSATFNPDACGPQPDYGPCSTRGGFVATVFGCAESACADFTSYEFAYSSGDRRLVYNSWRESYNVPGTPNGTVGDIATS